jgi:hypothetical protein
MYTLGYTECRWVREPSMNPQLRYKLERIVERDRCPILRREVRFGGEWVGTGDIRVGHLAQCIPCSVTTCTHSEVRHRLKNISKDLGRHRLIGTDGTSQSEGEAGRFQCLFEMHLSLCHNLYSQ